MTSVNHTASDWPAPTTVVFADVLFQEVQRRLAVGSRIPYRLSVVDIVFATSLSVSPNRVWLTVDDRLEGVTLLHPPRVPWPYEMTVVNFPDEKKTIKRPHYCCFHCLNKKNSPTRSFILTTFRETVSRGVGKTSCVIQLLSRHTRRCVFPENPVFVSFNKYHFARLRTTANSCYYARSGRPDVATAL